MFIREKKEGEIKVAIPLTKATEKTRIKRRSMFNEYGIPVATRSEEFSQDCYVEWQIGYDVVKKDLEKLEKTTLKEYSFIGANGKEKTLYELSEYVKYFYDWGIVSKKALLDIKEFLSNIKSENFIDVNEELAIKRTHPINKTLNGFDFKWTKVEYPLLVYEFDKKYKIISEIKISEKQYAVGVQPMLYLCFPITELEQSELLLGRCAEPKEFANFVINKNNIKIFVEMLKLFGTLSQNHNKDIITIIEVILNNK